MDRALVLLNPRARRGAAARDYARVRSDVEASFRVRHTLIDAEGKWRRELDRARGDEVTRVFAVGGDGTLNVVANAILDDGAWPGLALGAVGLGSSNDFHKPCDTRLNGIPVRIGAPKRRDVGLATWTDAAGRHRRWFFVSASIGLCARANRRFSRAAWLGALSVDAAIAYSALSALFRHENIGALGISNLSVMLTPYLAGAFRYDTAVQAGGGSLAFHLCRDMSRRDLLRAMARLLGGQFGGANMQSWSSATHTVDLDRDEDLELDGELFRARSVRFEAVPSALAVCT